MSTLITATEAIRTFSNLLNQVHYQGKSFEIKRGNQVIAMISPASSARGIKISELNDFFHHLPALDKEDIEDFSATLKEIRSIQNETDPWE